MVHTRLGERFADACGDQNIVDQLALSWWKFMSVSALNAIRNGRLERAVALSRSEIQPERCRHEDGTDNASDDAMDHRRSLPSAGTSVGSSATATLVKVHVSVTLKATRHARLETAVKLGPSEI